MSGKASRDKGSRTERTVKEYFKKLGYESYRVPLSGASQGYKGDVVFTKDGNTLVAEVKSRKSSFMHIYAALDQSKSKQLSLILPSGKLCALSYDFEKLLTGYQRSFVTVPEHERLCRRLDTLFKLVKEADLLVLKDDRKQLIFIIYY